MGKSRETALFFDGRSGYESGRVLVKLQRFSYNI